jgi:hypothetical protein
MANPKNPVRAARQAKRQAVSDARTTRKVAKIEARAATKVAKIAGKTAKYTGKVAGVQPQQAPKSSSTTAPKTAPKTGLTGKDLLTYGVKPKSAAPAAKGPSYAPFKSPAAQKQSQQMTADAKRRKAEAEKRQQEAAQKKAAADQAARKKKEAADAKKRKEAAERKKKEAADAAAAAEAQRVKDMFLQPGETRENTLPYPFTEKAKLDEARRKLKETQQKYFDWYKDMGTRGSRENTQENREMDRSRTSMTTKYKKGGSTKRALYNKRKK